MNGNHKKESFRNWISVTGILCMVGVALLLRYRLIPFTNFDTDGYSRWYDFIVDAGISHALGQNFAIYTPPYLYLLALATLTNNVIPKIVIIKLIPIFFDLINAAIIFKILRLKYPLGKTPYLAAAIFLFAPTVVMNSALWGQIDSFYTCFLLLCVYFLLTDRPIPSMFTFGLAVSIKAQAAFLGPFLLLMGFKKRIPFYAFGIVPLIYLGVMLPAILAGRTVLDVFTVYLNQAAQMQIPSLNAPNWYIFVPQSTYPVSMPMGMTIAVLIVAIWIYVYSRQNFPHKHEIVWYTALVSTTIMPFLLPKMHERYFYPAEVFSLVLAFFSPEFWFIPLCYQVISSLAYSVFLFEAPRSTMLVLATELNTLVIAYLSWRQFRLLKDSADIHEHTIKS
jgi:Gpi18-like mannosyltransferase